MKKTFLIIFFLSTILSAFGQIAISNEKGVKTFYPDTSEACNPDLIFTIVETMPEYKGGLQQLENKLNDKLDFDKDINGTIFISIYINCKDKAYGFQVLKGIDKKTDNMLIKELQNLQNWTSGIQRNKKVDCHKNVGFKIKKGKVIITNK